MRLPRTLFGRLLLIFIVFGVVMTGRDTLNTFAADNTLLDSSRPRFHTWFAQADYVIVPPLQAAVRNSTASTAARRREAVMRASMETDRWPEGSKPGRPARAIHFHFRRDAVQRGQCGWQVGQQSVALAPT